MNTVPTIFDRQRLTANRTRAAANFAEHDFLHRHIAAELAQRLHGFNRHFDRALCLGSSGGLLTAAFDDMATPAPFGWLCEADLTPAMLPRRPYNGRALVLDEERLPLAPQSCDAIVALWGLHHVNDLPGTLVQIRAALKPDGLFLAAIPGISTLAALRQAFLLAESELAAGIAPHIHPFADLRDLAGLLQRTGYSDPVSDSDIIPVSYQNPMRLLHDLRGMGEANILLARHKTGLRRDVLARALEIFSQNTAAANGRACAEFEICYLSGRAGQAAAPSRKTARPHLTPDFSNR
ncbi:MAG: class I SAM-dependent methyltransferase [Parvibaculales bacterium]